jgi:hypothetical protein
MGGYFSLYMLNKLASAVGGKKVVTTEAAPPLRGAARLAAEAAAKGGDAIPSIEDPAFAEWLEKDGNIEKLLTSA